MVYFSAVGMVNALGYSLSEVKDNLCAGLAPGMAPGRVGSWMIHLFGWERLMLSYPHYRNNSRHTIAVTTAY